jgi:hypothetical protein
VAATLSLAQARAQAVPKVADPTDPAAAKARLLKAAYLEGQLTSVDADEKKFSIQAIDKVQVLNPKMQQAYATAQTNYNNAIRNRNPSAAGKHLAEMRDAQAKMYDTQEIQIDFDLKGTDKINVRTQITPTKEDGSKYSQVELAGLKGTNGLPGYAAKISSLEKAQWVRVYIDKNKLGSTKVKDDVPLPVLTIVIEPDKDKEKPTPKK